jgi:aminoglycoside/choline kinase family phosphotransferase
MGLESDRQHALKTWTAQALGIPEPKLEPASADASFRRYFRTFAHERSYVLMDAPPPQEDCRPFVRIAALMHAAGVHAPEILAQDLQRGFLLLSDLGLKTYLEVLDEHNAEALFADAVEALILWQQATHPGTLPPYDRALLKRELMLFPDWYVGRHLQVRLSPGEQTVLNATFQLLEDSALAQPQVYVHRDYMPRNLMLSEPNPGVLDFQDAVEGPITYDLLSLFKDAFISWEEERVAGWCRGYWERARRTRLPVQDDYAEFQRALDWMGIQRHLKVIGIFARIRHRDGKPHYLEDTPRFLKYLWDTGRLYKEFTPLLELLDNIESRAAKKTVLA